jgi:hypothetical protein
MSPAPETARFRFGLALFFVHLLAQPRIQGPRARGFFTAFAKGSATGIKANGGDILSV